MIKSSGRKISFINKVTGDINELSTKRLKDPLSKIKTTA
jgi:hypothetical protein